MRSLSLTKEDILRSALKFVKAEGIYPLSMRSIAKHTGVSVGSLYNYFGDRDTLMK